MYGYINKETGKLSLDGETGAPMLFTTRQNARDSKLEDEAVKKLLVVVSRADTGEVVFEQ